MKSKAKVALVTGGGQGIGRGVAERFAADGWRVVVAEADAEAGREAEAALRPAGRFVATDTSSEGSVRRAIESVRAKEGRLDALINNAGVSEFIPLEKMTLADWNRIIGINLTGYFLMAKHAAPLLAASRGSIVNIASTRAIMSEPGNEAYSASKGGILALTHALALSLGPKVRVNSISPGWIEISQWQKKRRRKKSELRKIDHAQHPAGRAGNPNDIAALVAYLTSSEAGFVTGSNFVIDGGMARKMIYAD